MVFRKFSGASALWGSGEDEADDEPRRPRRHRGRDLWRGRRNVQYVCLCVGFSVV